MTLEQFLAHVYAARHADLNLTRQMRDIILDTDVVSRATRTVKSPGLPR